MFSGLNDPQTPVTLVALALIINYGGDANPDVPPKTVG